MSRTLRKSFLRGDLAAASALLSSIPEDDAHILDRIGIESRIEQARQDWRGRPLFLW
jgi:phage gp29-like protein